MAADKKYNDLVEMLRKSTPELSNPELVRENILREIRREKTSDSILGPVGEFLFGWIYVGWLRRSLVTIAVAVIIIFGYQQAVIIRKINNLSGKRIQNGSAISTSITDDISSRVMYYRFTGKMMGEEKIDVSEKEINKLIIEINRLKLKYEDLIFMIENDPQLKEYFESKLNQETH